MLVLLSFALVLLATVLLVLGLLNDDGLTLIYISIASSVAAAVVLLAALRINKPRSEETRRTAPEPLPEPVLEPVAVGASGSTARAGAADVTQVSATDESSEWLASDQDAWASSAAAPAIEEAPRPSDADVILDDEEGEEVEFPIADYDTLTVGQILPLLPQLYTDEIDVVEERERSTKARPQVLAKLAELRGDGALDDPLASYTEPVAAAPGWDDEEWFPIEDYESLSAAQIQPLLPELDAEELALVRARELSLGRRRSLLDEIDRLMGNAREAAEPAASRAAAASPSGTSVSQEAKKTAARKTTAKKAPTKQAATKKSAPAKKVAATKAAPAKKVAPATKAAPATKKAAATTKSSAKTAAAPAKKAATKKAATPAKKAATKASTPAKKAATKKAAPAKKAAKKSR